MYKLTLYSDIAKSANYQKAAVIESVVVSRLENSASVCSDLFVHQELHSYKIV